MQMFAYLTRSVVSKIFLVIFDEYYSWVFRKTFAPFYIYDGKLEINLKRRFSEM